jgi:hypothetical protein
LIWSNKYSVGQITERVATVRSLVIIAGSCFLTTSGSIPPAATMSVMLLPILDRVHAAAAQRKAEIFTICRSLLPK